MFDYRISAQVAESHRQDLIAEAKRHRVAKAATRKSRRSVRNPSPRRSTNLAIAS